MTPSLPGPTGWVPFELAPPSLSRSHGVTQDGWEAWQAPDGVGRSVSACFGLDLSTWTNEAAPFAFERLDALAGSVGRQLAPPLAVRVGHEERTLTALTHELGREPDGAPVGKTFLGFVSAESHPRLEACFVLCVAPGAECVAPLRATTPPPFVPPPRESLLVHTLVVGMHHPTGVAGAGATLFLSLGALAVATRPRPRRK